MVTKVKVSKVKVAPEIQAMIDRHNDLAEKLKAGRLLYALVDSRYSEDEEERLRLKKFLDDSTKKNRADLETVRNMLMKEGVVVSSFPCVRIDSFSDWTDALGITVHRV